MQYRTEHFELRMPSAADCAAWVSSRNGETRLGQEVLFRTENNDSWKEKRFHLLGICEDIGPRANGGSGGSDMAFSSFIQRFLAVQSNRFLNGNNIAVHGAIIPTGVVHPDGLSGLVSMLDALVVGWTQEIVENGGIPVVIGGGHNNAYGLIKGTSLALAQPIAVINLDPHADTRELEGRHSGNPFSYAHEEGFLDNYTVLGLHQSYNNQAILRRLDAMRAASAWFEDWIDEPGSYYEDIRRYASGLAGKRTGVELDLDSIRCMPSSAFTPSGVSVEQARFYVRRMAESGNAAYLHLPEGAPKNPPEELIVGKTLAYLVTDFIKCHSNSMNDA